VRTAKQLKQTPKTAGAQWDQAIRVLRFELPDVRKYLDDEADIADTPLFREIEDVALTDLPSGWTLVLNLSPLRPINTALYRCLLQVRQIVHARPARLILCGLTREHRDVFELFQAYRLFTIVRSEAEALRAAEREMSA
jgi:anti-anti-sigma regulatory factor